MTSPLAALNHNLERLKMNVQMRKRQRRDWMQRLMKETVSQDNNSHAHEDGTAAERAANSDLKLVLIDTADGNNANMAGACEIEADSIDFRLCDAASRQGSASNSADCH